VGFVVVVNILVYMRGCGIFVLNLKRLKICRWEFYVERCSNCRVSCSKVVSVITCCSLKRSSSTSVSSCVAGAKSALSVVDVVIDIVSRPSLALET